MIKIFKKIRYDLKEKNKTGRYLKYAVGELILIVTGILFALQINNWNQDRNDRKAEIIFINSLMEDLNQETYRLNRNFKLGKLRLEAIDFILNNLDNGFKSDNATKLDTALSICLIITLEKEISLKEYNMLGRLDKIRDNNLKKQITDYFQASDNFSRFENLMICEFFRNNLLPFYYKNLNVNNGLSLLPELPFWKESQLFKDQDVMVGNLYKTTSSEKTFLDILDNRSIKAEMVNLFSEYYFASEIANKSYPSMIEDVENLLNECKKFVKH